jgi:hypothetical protein
MGSIWRQDSRCEIGSTNDVNETREVTETERSGRLPHWTTIIEAVKEIEWVEQLQS